MTSRFQRWTIEGQLLTFVMGVTFVTCLYFWVFVDPALHPDILNQILLGVLGLWGTNLGYGVKSRADDKKAEDRKAEESDFQRRLEEALAKRQRNEYHESVVQGENDFQTRMGADLAKRQQTNG